MNHPAEKPAHFTPFWPVCLVAISLVVFLGWQVTVAAQQYIALVRLADQQTALANQAVQAEVKLQAMMMDLLMLSLSNPQAKAIVNKHGVKFNPPASAKEPTLLQPRPKAKEGDQQKADG